MIFELEHQFSHAVLAQHDSPFSSAMIVSYDGGGTDGAFNVRGSFPKPRHSAMACTAVQLRSFLSFRFQVFLSRSKAVWPEQVSLLLALYAVLLLLTRLGCEDVQVATVYICEDVQVATVYICEDVQVATVYICEDVQVATVYIRNAT
jgi:hypothetical protein